LIYKLAGIVGVDPGPLTLRQLAWMAKSKQMHQWNIASSMMALAAEINRDRRRRSRPFKPEEFNPLLTQTSRPIPITVSQLAGVMGRSAQSHTTKDPCHRSKPEPPTLN